jgi:hypothetical protein
MPEVLVVQAIPTKCDRWGLTNTRNEDWLNIRVPAARSRGFGEVCALSGTLFVGQLGVPVSGGNI